MPSYKILKEESATMDGVEGVVYEVELKADNDYSEVQKYFATSEAKLTVLEEATRNFQLNQPQPSTLEVSPPAVEVEVTL